MIDQTIAFEKGVVHMSFKKVMKYDRSIKPSEMTIPIKRNEYVELPNYSVSQTAVFLKEIDSETSEIKRSMLFKLIWIDRITQNLETGTVTFDIIFYARKQFHRVFTTRAIFSEKKIQQLAEIGADVSEGNYRAVISYLLEQERILKNTHYEHSSLGWKKNENELVYYHANSLTKKGVANETRSTYNGNFDIQPQGSYQGWRKVITEQVLGRPQLEFALVYGFSAVINALLAESKSLDVLMLHIYGDSSTGKTTASQLMVSGFGKPNSSGLLKSWNGTFNATMKILAGNHGVPLVLDESSTKTNAQFTEIIYLIGAGLDKARLDSESKLRDQEEWDGAFGSTGEQPLTALSNQNTGKEVRIIEIGNRNWTESAAHAEVIKNQLMANHGQAGPLFAQYVINHYQEGEWSDIFDQIKLDLIEEMPSKDSFSERLANKYAIQLLTAHLMNECFDFEVSIDGLQEYLIEIDQENMATRSLETRSYEFLQQKILENQASFNTAEGRFSGLKCSGSIKKKSDYLEVAVLKGVMEEWLREGQFSSSDVVLKGLKKDGLLDHEANKHSRDRKLPDDKGVQAKQTVYVLKMPSDLLDSISANDDTVLAPPAKKKGTTALKKIKGMRPNIAAMMAEDLQQ